MTAKERDTAVELKESIATCSKATSEKDKIAAQLTKTQSEVQKLQEKLTNAKEKEKETAKVGGCTACA